MTTKIKSGVISDNAITSAHISSGAISSSHLTGIDTDAVSEGSSNLYFTNARADARVNAVLPNTGSLTEGSNLYFTTARVDSHLSGGTGVTYSSGAISIGQSVATSASPTFANLTLTGNLNITGDVDSVSVTDLDVTDKTITVGVGGTASANDGAGIVVDGASASILWDNSNTSWDFNNPIEIGSGYGGTPNTESQLILNDSGNNYITIGSGATSEGGILFADSDDNDVGVISYNHSTNSLGFRTNGVSNRMIIDSSGKVVIGDTSAGTYQLKVDSGSNGTSDALAGIFIEGQRSGVVYNLVSNNTANAANRGSGIQFRSGGFLTSGIIGRSDAIAASGDAPGYLTFHTSADGTEDLSERMRINSSGQIGIGTDDIGTNSKLDVFGGAVQILNTGATEGSTADATLHIKGAEPTQDRLIQMSAIGTSKKALNLIASTDANDASQWWSWGVDTDDEFKILKGIGFADSNAGIRINNSGDIKTTGLLEIASSQPRIHLDRNDGSYSWNIYNGDGTGNFPISTFNIANNAGTAVITALDNGNVGIGTTSPSRQLHLNNSSDHGIMAITGGTSNLAGVVFGDTADDDVSGIIHNNSGNYLYFNTSSTERMRIDSSGNVGIGYTTPYSKLWVEADGINLDDFSFEDASSISHLTLAGSNAHVRMHLGTMDVSPYGVYIQGSFDNTPDASGTGNSGTEPLLLNPLGGNVGVGTTNPTGSGTILHFNSSSNVADFHVTNSVTGATSTDGFILRVTDPADVEYINREGATTDQIWYQGSTRVMSLRASSGNLAIGSHNPSHKVHIHGGSADTVLAVTTNDNYASQIRMMEDAAGTQHGGYIQYDGNGDYLQLGHFNAGTKLLGFTMKDDGKTAFGSNLTNPLQNVVVGTTTNYDPPGLGSSNANFAILKRDASSSGDYGMITGISSDGNVWSQVQRVDGTATAYNLYLQPDGGSVGIGIPQNHTYIPNLIYPLRVGKSRSGTGNVTDYLSKIAIDGIGYGGSNYQMAAIDFTGGDTAGKSGNLYGRIGCSSMNGANNSEEGSLEFFVRAPGYSMETAEAMKICGKAGTSIAGSGNSRNGVLFPFQGIAIDRTWANYPGIAVGNSSHYSSSSSTQAEFRFHGANFSSDSYPGTSGSDFSVNVRTDGSFISTSDGRAKTNITTIDNALATVKQLTGKRFQRINRENEPQEHLSKNGYKFGFIAQEVEDIIPETVQYHADEDDGTENWNSAYAMDYGSVVALLVNAIKEQDTTIQDLKSRIETLEG